MSSPLEEAKKVFMEWANSGAPGDAEGIFWRGVAAGALAVSSLEIGLYNDMVTFLRAAVDLKDPTLQQQKEFFERAKALVARAE